MRDHSHSTMHRSAATKKGRVRATLTGVALLLVAALLTAGVGSGQAHATRGPAKVTCLGHVYSQTPTSLTGFDFGLVSCAHSLGNGVQYDHYTETVTPPTVSAQGPFTWFFDDGTVSGTFKFAGTISSPTLTFTGTLEITTGTGAFTHANAHGDLTCTSNDGGSTFTCTWVGTGTGL